MKSYLKAAVLLGAMLTGACGFGGKSDEDGEQVVTSFTERAGRGDFRAIYIDAAPGLRAGATEAEFSRVMQVVNSHLGARVEAKPLAPRVVQADGQALLRLLTYQTEFEKGAATEFFYIQSVDGESKLYRYDISSDALIHALIQNQKDFAGEG